MEHVQFLINIFTLGGLVRPIKWINLAWLTFMPPNYNIGISIDSSNGELNKIFHNELITHLHNLIEKNNLENHLKINDFSQTKKITNQKQAEGYRNKKDIDLLIWGDFSPDALEKEGKRVVQPRLKFTFRAPLDSKNKLKDMMLVELGSIAASKNIWKIITYDNSFIESKELPKNTFDLSIYIIALSLKLFGKFDKSMSLFESILESRSTHDQKFIESVKFHLINIYILLLVSYAWKKSDYNETHRIALKLLKLSKNNLNGLAAKALCENELGLSFEAEKTVDLLLQEYPNSPLTWVDIAFISCMKKNYKRAYKYYKKLELLEDPIFHPSQVIDFIEGYYDKTGEIALLFASGYLNYLFVDEGRGLTLLKEFTKSANRDEYKYMFRKSKKIINKFKKK